MSKSIKGKDEDKLQDELGTELHEKKIMLPLKIIRIWYILYLACYILLKPSNTIIGILSFVSLVIVTLNVLITFNLIPKFNIFIFYVIIRVMFIFTILIFKINVVWYKTLALLIIEVGLSLYCLIDQDTHEYVRESE